MQDVLPKETWSRHDFASACKKGENVKSSTIRQLIDAQIQVSDLKAHGSDHKRQREKRKRRGEAPSRRSPKKSLGGRGAE